MRDRLNRPRGSGDGAARPRGRRDDSAPREAARSRSRRDDGAPREAAPPRSRRDGAARPRSSRYDGACPRRRFTAAAAAAAALVLAAGVAAVAPVTSGFTTATRPGASSFAAAPVFPPRLLTAPAIYGNPVHGETLFATDGTWARGVDSVAIEWLRCDGSGGCVAVGTGAERELTAADVGAVMRVRVTATNAGGSADARSGPTATVAEMPAPRITTDPKIIGTPVVGRMVAVSDGAWEGRVSMSRRWLRCTSTCAAIPGETDATYLVTGEDGGAALKVEVTASNVAGTLTATSPLTAPATRETYVHLLCRNPRDGAFAGADGALPDGLTFGANVSAFPSPAPAARCASPGGVPLSTGGTWTTSTVDGGGWLQYRGTSDVQFASAVLYRHGQMGGSFSWAINTATSTGIFATPRDDLCSWGFGCASLGTPTAPFASQNRVDVSPGAVNGFNVLVLCDIPAGRTCSASGGEKVVLTGGSVRLRDVTTPRVTVPASGGIVDHAALAPVETLSFGASDAGSGLYRVRVTVDNRDVAVRRLPGADQRCADADPGGGDAYEFSARRPCPASASPTMELDTTAWPKQGRLHVYVEDAGRNPTVLVNRSLGD